MTNCFEKSKWITMFAKYGCSKYERSKKNPKRYDPHENAVCVP